ncbi:MAG: hypothetical protein M1168_00785 [Candidatus Marsarchaeota archaeon]|jgi:hypothetical protein|nr:hypothetical protein [Candidatus Marsarchaeota archaeon]MCL5094506.1 hypothetical protein [Candidatus Marsarchaeota archaeon]
MSFSNIFEELSLNELILRLHKLITEFTETLDTLIDHNKTINYKEINELRTLIKTRIRRGEDIEDNKKLLNLLELFSSNKSILELIREDVDEWIDFIEAIDKLVNDKKLNANKEEIEDIEKIKQLNLNLKTILRAENKK